MNSHLKKTIKKTIREYLNDDIKNNDIDSAFNYFNGKYLNHELQENLENAYNELSNLINGGKIIAYRVLNVDDINDIDVNNLGIHFTTDKENVKTDDFLEKIGVIDYEGYYENDKFFLITIESDVNNIDWYKTFDNRINYYGEDEINFIDDTELKILKIEEIEI